MTTYISELIHEVYKTRFEALVPGRVGCFLSLQSWRATLIPIVAKIYFIDRYLRFYVDIRLFTEHPYSVRVDPAIGIVVMTRLWW